MSSLIDPFSIQVAIVDQNGRPTAQFQRLMQKLRLSSTLTKDDTGIIGLAANSITDAMLTDMANGLIKARKTAGTGDPENCTISEILDFIGSVVQGDILFRGSTGWQRLAAGTSGKFLMTNGPAANPSWAPATGGASLEKSFTAPPALTNWTQQNFQATTSALDITVGTDGAVGGVRLKNLPTANIGNVNKTVMLLRAIPSAHWRVTARMRFTGIHTSFSSAGIISRETATSKSVVFGFIAESGALGRQNMTNDNTYSGVVGFGTSAKFFTHEDMWYRLSYDGTTFIFEMSKDGYNWVKGYSNAGATAGFFTTAASHVGISIGLNDTGAGSLANRHLDLISWQEEVLP